MADIDLTKDEFENLNPVTGSFKTLAGVLEVKPHESVKLPDGSEKLAPKGGYVVKFTSGMVQFYSKETFDRFFELT